MPKCSTCSNYWFKDWSINKECRLGHDTPDFGDTQACSEYEEQFTIGMKEGWSYKGEQAKEHEEIGDFQEDKRRSEDSDSGGGNSSSYSSGSSTGDGGAVAGIVLVGIILVVIFSYFNSNKITNTTSIRNNSTPATLKMRVVAPQELNLRNGPGTQYGILGKIYANDVVDVYRTENGWSYIGSGWVNSKFLANIDARSEDNNSASQAFSSNICGTWEYIDSQTGGKTYIGITQKNQNTYQLKIGYPYNGSISWAGIAIENSDGIYLNKAGDKLFGDFYSSNFYATHSMEFRYKITLYKKPNNKLFYSVWSEIRGETDEREATKVSE